LGRVIKVEEESDDGTVGSEGMVEEDGGLVTFEQEMDVSGEGFGGFAGFGHV